MPITPTEHFVQTTCLYAWQFKNFVTQMGRLENFYSMTFQNKVLFFGIKPAQQTAPCVVCQNF